MNIGGKSLLLLVCFLLFSGWWKIFQNIAVDGLAYDYTASIQCLASPYKPQYGGGIIRNPEFNNGLRGWSPFGGAKIERRESGGNPFIVVHSRNQTYDSFSQKIYLQKDKLYTFSAWIQVREGINAPVPVRAVFKTSTDGFKHVGAVFAKSGCWSMLKGGLTMKSSGPADLFFESKNTKVEIWVDSISLQPFTQEQWKSHQDQSIEKTRKRKVRIQAIDAKGNPLPNATVKGYQQKMSFPFGNAMNKHILDDPAHQNWFTSRFTVTAFENALKWYINEPSAGNEDYSDADALFEFTEHHRIAVRGHTILWDYPKYQPRWLVSLSPAEIRSAADKRVDSVVRRYLGRVNSWDVVNENLHHSFFENKLGADASAVFWEKTRQIDGKRPLFMNEYNTLENSADPIATPANYLQKLTGIASIFPEIGSQLGIGLQGHFHTPDLAYVRSSLDTLAAAHLPIWITELDVASSSNQASHLEQVLSELYAYPAVEGIVMWAAWRPEGCFRMCLTDGRFKNLPTGDVVDKLIREWTRGFVGITDSNGFFETSLFHGDYEVSINHPKLKNSTELIHGFKVAPPDHILNEVMLVKLHV